VNVYVESNFVLELALAQEQCASCESLLDLCESGAAHLIIPACALSEPYETLARRHKERTHLRMSLEREFGQLGRTAAYTHRASDFASVVALLASSADEESERLQQIQARLLREAEVIPLNQEVFAGAIDRRGTSPLTPQDSLIFSSVSAHLRRQGTQQASCFLNRDLGFRDSDLTAELQRYRCKLLARFDHGYEYVRGSLAP
jgi:hypothetical protein